MKSKKNYVYILLSLYLVIFSFKINVLAATTLDCTAWGKALTDLQNLFDLCKIIIPLVIIGLSIVDFIKALTGKDDKEMKKSFSRLLKRFALAVVFFFLPVLLNFILDMIGTGSSVCLS